MCVHDVRGYFFAQVLQGRVVMKCEMVWDVVKFRLGYMRAGNTVSGFSFDPDGQRIMTHDEHHFVEESHVRNDDDGRLGYIYSRC